MGRKQKLDWLNEIEIEDLLEKDTELIANKVGLEVLIKLWEYLPSFNLYISTIPITKAKMRYIERFYDGGNAKEIATKLGISERTFYRLLSALRKERAAKRKGRRPDVVPPSRKRPEQGEDR